MHNHINSELNDKKLILYIIEYFSVQGQIESNVQIADFMYEMIQINDNISICEKFKIACNNLHLNFEKVFDEIIRIQSEDDELDNNYDENENSDIDWDQFWDEDEEENESEEENNI